MAAINPYLNFNGNCAEAMNHYKSVFGTEFHQFSRFKDMPGDQSGPETAELILHAVLPIGDGTLIMASDCPPHYGKMTFGDSVSISVNTDSEEEANRIFNGLAAGGKVKMPMEKTFWGAYFGMLEDAFGIHWMVNYDFKQEAA